jgi:hypothetical protein
MHLSSSVQHAQRTAANTSALLQLCSELRKALGSGRSDLPSPCSVWTLVLKTTPLEFSAGI